MENLGRIRSVEAQARGLRIPWLLLHGTADDVVPLEPNSGEFARRYKAIGGDITVEIVEGGNHGAPLKSFFESPAALAFLLE